MSSRTRCKITSFHLHIYCPIGTYSLVFISFGTNLLFFMFFAFFCVFMRFIDFSFLPFLTNSIRAHPLISMQFRVVLCNSVVAPYPCAPNVLFWAQLLLNQVVYVVVKISPCISATGFVHGGRSPCILAFTLYTLHPTLYS